MKDPYNLQRFIDAQNPVIEDVCSELRAGQKVGHWMWFIFPQMKGLGHSYLANQYAISSKAEALAYISHPVLGTRLKECTELVCLEHGCSIKDIFGYPDFAKFRSSMTLFSMVTSDNQVYLNALAKYFQGQPDPLTVKIIEKAKN